MTFSEMTYGVKFGLAGLGCRAFVCTNFPLTSKNNTARGSAAAVINELSPLPRAPARSLKPFLNSLAPVRTHSRQPQLAEVLTSAPFKAALLERIARGRGKGGVRVRGGARGRGGGTGGAGRRGRGRVGGGGGERARWWGREVARGRVGDARRGRWVGWEEAKQKRGERRV